MIFNLVLRPIVMEDLDQLYELSLLSTVGLTSLPQDKVLLKEKIELSQQAFSKKSDLIGEDYYLFVLEDLVNNKIIGISALLAAVGINSPFISFEKNIINTQSTQLDIKSAHHVLEFKKTFYDGSELLTLFLHPDYRQSGIGRFLSLSRFFFIRQNQLRFKKRVFAEIRGQIDASGQSLFYNTLIKPFLKVPFEEADLLSQVNKSFIIDLLPKSPLILDYVDKEISKTIGMPHNLSFSAMKILESEGFQQSNIVDVLDAGPKVIADLKSLRVFSQMKQFSHFKIMDTLDEKALFIVSSGSLADFRVCVTHVDDYDRIAIYDTPAFKECVKSGNKLNYARLYPKSRRSTFFNMGVNSQRKTEASVFLQEFSHWYQDRLPTHQQVEQD